MVVNPNDPDVRDNPWLPQTELAKRLREMYGQAGELGAGRNQDIQNAIQDPRGVAERVGMKVAEHFQDPMNFVGGGVGHTLYHGTDKVFNKFSKSRLGTGEGNAAYGVGAGYFAENGGLGRGYAQRLDKSGGNGVLYKVDIPDDQLNKLLNWDVPFHQQPQEVQHALNEYFTQTKYPFQLVDQGPDAASKLSRHFVQNIKTGESQQRKYHATPEAAMAEFQTLKDLHDKGGSMYQRMGRQSKEADTPISQFFRGNQDQAASDYLENQGVLGLKYWDEPSRVSQSGMKNMVIFNEDMPRILERNGVPTGQKPWRIGEWADELRKRSGGR